MGRTQSYFERRGHESYGVAKGPPTESERIEAVVRRLQGRRAYLSLDEVLKNVYQSFRKQAFPMVTPLVATKQTSPTQKGLFFDVKVR